MNTRQMDLSDVLQHQRNMLKFSINEVNVKRINTRAKVNSKMHPKFGFNFLYIFRNGTVNLLNKLIQAGK